MARVYTDPQHYKDIAAAIRTKNGTATKYKPENMASAILAIETDPVINPITITENGTYTAGTGVDGYSPVTVNVGGGGEKNADIHWYCPKICEHDKQMIIHSDCELKTPLATSAITHSSNISSLSQNDTLNILALFDSENLIAGEHVTFEAISSVYRFQNGKAEKLNAAIQPFTVSDIYEPIEEAVFKRDCVSRMTVIRNNSYMDSGADTATFDEAFPGVGLDSSSTNSVSINADSYLTVSGLQIFVNKRDSSIYYSWKEEGDCKCGTLTLHYMKVRWKGASYYSGSIDQEWEIVLFPNGDVLIRLIRQGSGTGTFSFKGETYTITTTSTRCFYRQDFFGTKWVSYLEDYDYSHHCSDSEVQFVHVNFSDKCKSLGEGAVCINNVAYDDGTYTVPLSSFTWHDASNVVASGNSWMGIGGSNENVRMHRRDSKMWYLYISYWYLQDLDGLKAACISWRGASAYSGSIDRWWNLWLFENGDAMIYISTIGNTGTCTFFDQSYTGQADSFISFYYDQESSNYDIKYERYTTEHHIG